MADPITLPPLPEPVNKHGFNCIQTLGQLRARDLEVVRLVLEAAAGLVDGNADHCSGQTAAILVANADAIRALEVRHHE